MQNTIVFIWDLLRVRVSSTMILNLARSKEKKTDFEKSYIEKSSRSIINLTIFQKLT